MNSPRPQLVRVVALTTALAYAPLLSGAYASASVHQTPNCKSIQLTLNRGQRHVVAGATYTALVITNVGTTCAIWGVPAIQPVNAARRPIGPFARNLSMGEMPLRHVLARGGSVSVSFGVTKTTSVPSSTCHAARAAGVVVTLGPFFTRRFLAMPLSVCTASASTTTRLLAPGTKG
ncbi:MAG TPA: DUF4232 domain-containing protein [Acidimicrobiales bacterium]|nr:MAG: hypothetical protein B7X07_02495 [Actinobacteria bacterium 21-64-8]HQT99217.1 DUF4232 domain-containing protein [Acidimicrobiales bacterium]